MIRVQTFNYFIPNFKVGLTNNVDLQVIPEVYTVQRTKPKGGGTEERSGFGDITARVKVNFWGNDGGKTAFGMRPTEAADDFQPFIGLSVRF
ncbi:hypothetical protein [Nostoc sp. 'Peltigera membranacea cyanobiont' 210A]|uniref:hypothetical protein n=1 Tax=Nostoc sp. 'Peltigera membranacea cyanobiont' 210A TaxID=2014529 RepID=UPI00167EA851|nr:hypothetical protein [Nostoc sp. 'Peltigera membranacea cyanobiont' 210A]